jgi:malonyl CoA-acyl carrier protein transacylase
MQRLQLHFPQHSRAQLQAPVDWVRRVAEVAKRVHILRTGWRSEQSELQGKTERLLHEVMELGVQRR